MKKYFATLVTYRNLPVIREYAFTDYFESEALRKRTNLKKECCIQVCKNAVKVEE